MKGYVNHLIIGCLVYLKSTPGKFWLAPHPEYIIDIYTAVTFFWFGFQHNFFYFRITRVMFNSKLRNHIVFILSKCTSSRLFLIKELICICTLMLTRNVLLSVESFVTHRCLYLSETNLRLLKESFLCFFVITLQSNITSGIFVVCYHVKLCNKKAFLFKQTKKSSASPC